MRKLAIALLLTLLLTNIARADLPVPLEDFTKLTPDGEYIFVMLAKGNGDNFSVTGIWEVPEIRATYSQSGLYSASDPAQMLYSVDWNSSYVTLSNNGEYLVRWGPWASKHNYREIAFEFYRNGQLFKSYKVEDLTNRFDQLSYSISHYLWLEKQKFNPKTNQLTIDLISGEHYVFDITTGEMIDPNKGITLMQGGLALLLIIGPASTGWLIWRKRQTV